ncbi:MAG: DUF3144 domain-containing protein [Arenicellales bacterium]|jgi:hypothetical protein|nr:DUF3144 domain-containing protein [Arenicellales bacterium]|tara:strand:- start:1701 stop:2042 length:342 start_codon:yes stop_codon:yes gene_type:complete
MSDQDEAEDHLSEEEIDQQFREMADKFIDLANGQAERVNRENVSLALLYAAARFNAFVVASHAKDITAYDADRERAAEYFRGQYRSMLDENMRDYREAFETLPYAHLIPDKSS